MMSNELEEWINIIAVYNKITGAFEYGAEDLEVYPQPIDVDGMAVAEDAAYQVFATLEDEEFKKGLLQRIGELNTNGPLIWKNC